jgi:hypothetical protein
MLVGDEDVTQRRGRDAGTRQLPGHSIDALGASDEFRNWFAHKAACLSIREVESPVWHNLELKKRAR